MNDRIRRMTEEIEKRGGSVYYPHDAPDEILEKFLEQVLACPCCATASAPDRSPRVRRKSPPRGH